MINDPTGNFPIDSTKLLLEAFEYGSDVNNEDPVLKSKRPLRKCNEDDFGKDYWKTGNFNHSYCLDNTKNDLYVQGNT